MLRNVPILALAFTVSFAAVVFSSRRPAPSVPGPQERAAGTDAWFV